jgi:hypothetical protein
VEWTTDKPTKSGYYWVKWTDDDEPPFVYMAFLEERDKTLLLFVEGEFTDPDLISYFMGPLGIPEPPNA